MRATLEASADTPTPAKAGAGIRILAGVGALVLAFIAAVAVVVMLDIGGLTPCEDVGNDLSKLNDDGECFDGSSTTKLIALIFGWPGTILAAVSVLLAVGVAARGRGGSTLVRVVVAAAVLLGLSLIIG